MYSFKTKHGYNYAHNVSATLEQDASGEGTIVPKVDFVETEKRGGACTVAGSAPIFEINCVPADDTGPYMMALFLRPVANDTITAHLSSERQTSSDAAAAEHGAEPFDVAMALSNGYPVSQFVSASDCTRRAAGFYTYGAACTFASFGFYGTDPHSPTPWPKTLNVSAEVGTSGRPVVHSTDPCTLTVEAPPTFLYQCNVYQIGLLFLPASATADWKRTRGSSSMRQHGLRVAKGQIVVG